MMLNKSKVAQMQVIDNVLGARLHNAEQIFNCTDTALKNAKSELDSASIITDETLEDWYACLNDAFFDPVLTQAKAKIFLTARKRHEDALQLIKSAEKHRESKRLDLLEANYNVRQIREKIYNANRQIRLKKEELSISDVKDLRDQRISQKC